jgi:hypothetical protein
MKRGLEFPGPIDLPESIAALAREWFKTAGVIPTNTAVMATLTPKGMRAN